MGGWCQILFLRVDWLKEKLPTAEGRGELRNGRGEGGGWVGMESSEKEGGYCLDRRSVSLVAGFFCGAPGIPG